MWGPWGEGPCSETDCQGTMNKVRECNNPPQANGGAACSTATAGASEQVDCNTSLPECPGTVISQKHTSEQGQNIKLFFLLLVALTLTSNIGIAYDDDFADTTHADFATLETYLSNEVDILKMFCSSLNV